MVFEFVDVDVDVVVDVVVLVEIVLVVESCDGSRRRYCCCSYSLANLEAMASVVVVAEVAIASFVLLFVNQRKEKWRSKPQ